MRRIPLKELTLLDPLGQPMAEPLRYATSIVAIAKAPAGGVSVEEMDLALEIETAVENAGAQGAGFVILEEAQHVYLAERTRTNRFPFASQAFREFAADIIGAEKFDPNASSVARIGPPPAAE